MADQPSSTGQSEPGHGVGQERPQCASASPLSATGPPQRGDLDNDETITRWLQPASRMAPQSAPPPSRRGRVRARWALLDLDFTTMPSQTPARRPATGRARESGTFSSATGPSRRWTHRGGWPGRRRRSDAHRARRRPPPTLGLGEAATCSRRTVGAAPMGENRSSSKLFSLHATHFYLPFGNFTKLLASTVTSRYPLLVNPSQ